MNVEYLDSVGRGIPVVRSYKNVARLMRKMKQHGCRFLTSAEVFDMPKQNFIEVKVKPTGAYKRFKKSGIIEIGGAELVGDTTLVKMLYERQLCSVYNIHKLEALYDLMESTNDRLVIFYNFNAELEQLQDACVDLNKPISIVNGNAKDLSAYEGCADSVTLVQYQAGAMGLNLQLANKVIYYSLPLSSELFEQSKKRIHRIGQDKPCFYYLMICRNSIEEKILASLKVRQDYTAKLFEKGVS